MLSTPYINMWIEQQFHFPILPNLAEKMLPGGLYGLIFYKFYIQTAAAIPISMKTSPGLASK